MLPSAPSQDVVERAERAEARLQAALRLVEASRLHAAQPPPPAAAAAATVDKTPDAPRVSSTPAPPDTFVFTACIPHLEWPLAPLMERAKAKRLRDAQRQRRRTTAAAASAVAQKASSMSAADMMRTTLAQPLGAMAARLLSAATAGAPSLFADSVAARVTSPPPDYLSTFSGALRGTPAGVPVSSATAALPGATLGSGSYKPLPSLSIPAARQDSGSFHAERTSQQHRPRHHHHRHGCASYSESPQRTSGRFGAIARVHTHASLRDLSTTSLSLPPDTSPTRHGGSQHCCSHRRRHHRHHHTPHCRHADSPSKPIALKPSTTPPGVPSSSSTTHTFFGNSPVSLLARTFGSGMAVGSSPTMVAERRLGSLPSAATTTARHGLQLATTRTPDTVVSAGGATPPAFASPPCPRRSFSSASLSSCTCSRRSCSDEWGCSSRTPSDASVLTSSASANVFRACLTAPGPDGAYDPHAALPSLQRCYGNALTHGCFEDISSTSTAHTASRSSTPFSSEWSAHSERTGASPTPPSPEATAVEEGGSAHIPRRRRGSRQPSAARRVGSLNERGHADDAHSPTVLTQPSFLTEMDAIEKGQVAPYVSYLFSPEARVVDLGPLEGQLRRGESTAAPAVSATCIRFCRDGAAYLVGTSSGLLWRVPVGGAEEAVRATPLGSIWPPAAQSLHPTPGTTANGGVGAGAAAASVDGDVGGVSSAPVASPLPAPQQPVPLAGHTAAILSIAFNDDGTLFATTGLDGCVIVWNASTSAKLRRISAGWAPQDATAPRAPHLVRFMPQNNNYLLVSYRESSELHLYNSSTGLPVTNVAGTGLTRVSVGGGGGGVMSGTTGAKHLPKAATKSDGGTNSSSISSRKGAVGVGGGAITALSVDPIASPFFVSGDAEGTVMLWSYRAGDLVTWPTLRATSPPTSRSGSGASRHARTRSYSVDALAGGMKSREFSSSFGGCVFATPLYQLPELRRITACVLPLALGGVGAINVTSLHTAQLHSLLRPCGPQQQQRAADTSGGGGRAVPPNPLEATAHVLHATALVNRACREAWEAAEDVARRGRRDGHGKGTSESKREDGSGKAQHTQSTVSGGSSGGGLPHVLAALPSKLSDTFSALWGGVSSSSNDGGGNYGASTAASLTASLRKDGGRVATANSASPSATTGCPTMNSGLSAFNEKNLLRQVRNDALDVVCPLLILVSTPSDTVYALGLLLQLQHGTSPHGSGGGSGGGGASGGADGVKPTVSYRLYPLLKTTGPSRMRHVGVGVVASPDNRRLVVVAAPCEEGFMRVLPLLRLDPVVVEKADCGGKSGGAAAATLSSNAARVNKRHVLATLPMPYGGRCTGLAWSPNGRFLVAITAEGAIYQWSRVYLFNTHAHAHRHGRGHVHTHRAAVGAAPVSTKRNSGSSSGGTDGGGGGGTAARATEGQRSTFANVHVDSSAAAAAASTAAHRRGCDTEYSDTVHQQSPSTVIFASLLGNSAAAPAGGAAAVAWESDAARAAFSEEDAWRQSLKRELERQRREQAAVKLVTQPGAGEANDVSSSGYWLDEGANSDGSRNTFDEDEETEMDDTASCS